MEISCTWVLVVLLILYVILGAAIAVLNRFIYIDNSKDYSFSRDGFVNLLMFLAESSGILIYSFLLCHSKRKTIIQSAFQENENNSDDDFEEEEKELSKIKKMGYLGLPAILDLIASHFGNFAMILMPTTSYIMIKELCLVLITFLISKFIMKNKHIWDHYIAIFIAIGALFLVTISLFFGANANYNQGKGDWCVSLIGIEFVIVAAIFRSSQFIFEQYCMRKYLFHPFFFIGFEGFIGLIFNIAICIGFYFIKCNTKDGSIWADICLKDEDGVLRLENILYTMKLVFKNVIKVVLVISSIICLGAYNIFGICINKYGGAMTRSVIENFKSVLVWFFFWLFWDRNELKEDWDWIALSGLFLVGIAILIYFGPFKIDEKITIRNRIKAITLRIESENNINASGRNSVVPNEY